MSADLCPTTGQMHRGDWSECEHCTSAAVPVPDAGDEALRLEMAEVLHEIGCEQTTCTQPRWIDRHTADALLPLTRLAKKLTVAESGRANEKEIANAALAAAAKEQQRAEQAEAEVERLTDWRGSAMNVMSGLQDLGAELGLPLGESITGTLAAETAHRLRSRAERAEAEVERLRTVTGMADQAGARILDERNAALAAIERVRELAKNWLRLSGQAMDQDVRGWTNAAARSLLAALDGEATP